MEFLCIFHQIKKLLIVVNKIAPEHLELNIKNYKNIVIKIKNSGSICLGKYAVMAMTDYNVGSTTYYLLILQQDIQVVLVLMNFIKNFIYKPIKKRD